MNKKYLAIFHSLWSIGIVVLVYISLEEFKLLPMLAVISMALAINYAIYSNYKIGLPKKNIMNRIPKSDNNKKLKIILRAIGVILFSIQLAIYCDFLQFKYDSYSSAVILFILVLIMSIGIIMQKKSESLE